jgi:hypothetical protein
MSKPAYSTARVPTWMECEIAVALKNYFNIPNLSQIYWPRPLRLFLLALFSKILIDQPFSAAIVSEQEAPAMHQLIDELQKPTAHYINVKLRTFAKTILENVQLRSKEFGFRLKSFEVLNSPTPAPAPGSASDPAAIAAFDSTSVPAAAAATAAAPPAWPNDLHGLDELRETLSSANLRPDVSEYLRSLLSALLGSDSYKIQFDSSVGDSSSALPRKCPIKIVVPPPRVEAARHRLQEESEKMKRANPTVEYLPNQTVEVVGEAGLETNLLEEHNWFAMENWYTRLCHVDRRRSLPRCVL